MKRGSLMIFLLMSYKLLIQRIKLLFLVWLGKLKIDSQVEEESSLTAFTTKFTQPSQRDTIFYLDYTTIRPTAIRVP